MMPAGAGFLRAQTSRRLLLCLHDATPACARETEAMIRDLAPLLGRRFSCAVVPDWHGAWPLAADPGYCRLLQERAEELLLHGCFHRRQRGRGLVSWLAGHGDEMNGLDADETRRTLQQGQRLFTAAFGAPARTFVAPAWQPGHVRATHGLAPGLEHVLGFFCLRSRDGRRVPLATSTWDCGRWASLGHVGHGIGRLLRAVGRRTPVLAIHPRDLQRGYWPAILRLTGKLLEAGYEPSTPSRLLEASDVDVDS
jgi:hypothetical protein